MRVLITGGAGFIGSHVAELYSHKGNDLMILDDLSTGRMEWIADLIQKRKWRTAFDLCDIRDRNHVRCSILAFQPQVVCHLAAQPAISTSWSDPILNAQVNELGTLNVLDAVIDADCGTRMIFASTSAVYAETGHILREGSLLGPRTPYGVSKLAAEQYVRELWPNSVLLRLGNVYGPKQAPIGRNQVVPLMLRHLLYGDDFQIIGDGNQSRDFVYVEDVADAFLLAAWGRPGTYNIASGISTGVNFVAHTLEEFYGMSGYEWQHSKEQDARRDVIMDNTAANNGLDWKPSHSLRDGLALTAEWWNNQK
jgi:UDP-glucose 4-epimerase